MLEHLTLEDRHLRTECSLLGSTQVTLDLSRAEFT